MTGEELRAGNKYKFETQCSCGNRQFTNWADLKDMAADGLDHHCKSCAMRLKMAATMATDRGREHQRRMTERAAATSARSADNAARGRTAWASDEEARVSRIVRCARQRCVNPRTVGWENYGGRGIEFRFTGTREGTRWVLDNLGLPGPGLTLDRIDNNRHYEPGNLRWATRAQQARNKRAYKNALPNIKLAMELRPDLSRSQLSVMLKRGDSLETIRTWKKYERSRDNRSPGV